MLDKGSSGNMSSNNSCIGILFFRKYISSCIGYSIFFEKTLKFRGICLSRCDNTFCLSICFLYNRILFPEFLGDGGDIFFNRLKFFIESFICIIYGFPSLFYGFPSLFYGFPSLFHSFPSLFHSFPSLFHSFPSLGYIPIINI